MSTRENSSSSRFFRDHKNSIRLGLLLLFLLVHGGGTCGPGKINKERLRLQRVPLRFRERVPDLIELSAAASGKSTGRVKRGTAEYDALISNNDPNIVFKEDDGHGDNRRMTKRCAAKLESLSSIVKEHWHGKVRVRVVKAYDDGEGKQRRKDPHSLHYEGRAVDITTSDLDRNKYPMLGRLAIEAGFDWVKYASKAYIHASVKSEEMSSKSMNNGCFYSNSSVQLRNGKPVLMKDLKIGDRVASLDDHGRIIYSPVIMFLHRNPNLRTTYLTINTLDHNKKLIITPAHFIYKLNKHTQRESVLYAKQLTTGDEIYTWNSSNQVGATTRLVTGIEMSELTGAFAPLTETGNIIVDGVAVSCYAVFPSNTISHWSMLPIRILTRFFPNFFETGEEVPWYPRMLFKFYSVFSQWFWNR